MRKKIIAGNWKMFTDIKSGLKLAEQINTYFADKQVLNKRIILGVPFTHIFSVAKSVNFTKISVAAQNCASEEEGAYTGEISVKMIKSSGASYVIIGHSERRQYFNETDEILKTKVDLCLKYSMFPIFCCGESLEHRKSNSYKSVIEKQITNTLFHLDNFNIERIIIAYEPIWAIGTGVTASPQQAQEVHEYIRKIIFERYGHSVAVNINIIYGGSVKPDNAKELFSMEDIDGGLIGGASLKAEDFIKIIESAS